MRTLLVAALAALLGLLGLLGLLACGTADSGSEPEAADPTTVATPTVKPTEIPTPSGPVVAVTTVLDDGDGAELCLGAVAQSLPPQCGGSRLIGWDWADHEGDYEEVNGVRWGDFAVTGTFDGTDLTPTSVVPADEHEPSGDVEEPESDFSTPCEEPQGGWVVDPATTTEEAQQTAIRVARRLPTFGQLWVDHSINPAADDEPGGLEWELAMSDPQYVVVNVAVTDDLAGAEAAIREVWGGPLCVSEAAMTGDDLRRIGRENGELPGVLGWGGESYPLDAYVTFDDGTLQAWVDQEYGEGVVIVTSALRPA